MAFTFRYRVWGRCEGIFGLNFTLPRSDVQKPVFQRIGSGGCWKTLAR